MPKGFNIIKYLYAFISVCFGFLIVFPSLHRGNYIEVIIWGNKLPEFSSVLVISVLVIFPLLLFLGFSRPSATVWYLALLYHLFFIGNSILEAISIILPNSIIEPMISIKGGNLFSYTETANNILFSVVELIIGWNFLLLIGLFALFYLWQQRKYFMPKKLIEKL